MDKKETKIFAFFTIMEKPISLIGFSNDRRKYLVGDERKSVASSYFLVQLGKNSKHIDENHFKKINSLVIWDYIYTVLNDISSVSFRKDLILLDCKKEMISYYEKQGFFQVGHDNMNDLYQMVTRYI